MSFTKNGLWAICLIFIVSCVQNRPVFQGKTETERVNRFFDWSFDRLIERSPMNMGYLGIKKRESEWDDFSLEYQKQTMTLVADHLEILESFDRDKLTPQAQLSYDLYKKQAELQVEAWQWRDHQYLVNQMYGMQKNIPVFLMNIHRVQNEQDLKNYLMRLSKFKTVFGQVITGLMRSETKGVVPPKFVFEKTIQDTKNMITGFPFDSSKSDAPLMKDFRSKLKKLKLDKKKELQYLQAGISSLKGSVQPAFEELMDFLLAQEKRATRDHGVWKFPRGDEFYKFKLKEMTTLNLTPQEIHQKGLDNVARIHQEMTAIRDKLKFKGGLKAFFKYMQKPKFQYKNNPRGRKKYLKLAENYIDKMRKNLDRFFYTKPKAPIEVKAVEEFREKSAGMAFYQSGTPDGSRPGRYYVNLSNMQALPSWEAQALAYHEGIPGHHMQISIAQELEKLPKFRRFGHYTSYIEGWGLYSERFPKEFGFYKDLHSDFGRLSMELVRACRLVVDSGLHWKKWTREKAIQYLDENTPGDHQDNTRQINRYIVMPGQATAYLVGMLKIVELREKAKKSLGSGFDIREFHDVILTNGAMPLDLMEAQVDKYIKTKKI